MYARRGANLCQAINIFFNFRTDSNQSRGLRILLRVNRYSWKTNIELTQDFIMHRWTRRRFSRTGAKAKAEGWQEVGGHPPPARRGLQQKFDGELAGTRAA